MRERLSKKRLVGRRADFGDGGDAVTSCSSDLRDVLDGSGKVLKTCPDDQGCANGKCVAACESARINKSTVGCDYYVAPPDIVTLLGGTCLAAFVANTWVTPVKLSVERDGQVLDVQAMARIPSGSGQTITYAPLQNGEIPPGQVAIVFLSRNGTVPPSCPAGVTPGFTSAPANVSGTGRGEAFHLTTTAPVVAYDIFPYGGGSSAVSSATLLIPTSAWDVNYLGVNAFRKNTLDSEGEPSLQIVAQEDGTEVKILPSAAIVGGTGVAATAAHQTGVYTLDRGQLLQFTQNEELSGSAIEASKPIGVFGGSSCMMIDVDKGACDAAHQQLPPIRALGSRYAAVRYRNRYDGVEESTPWRVVGAVNGTTLSYEPSAPTGAPTSLAFGEVAEFWTSAPFVVKSQDGDHPFYMSGHMTGWQTLAPSMDDIRGDPEFVNVIPPEQYLSSYVSSPTRRTRRRTSSLFVARWAVPSRT
jgi:IgGFc binding protein